MKMEKRHRYVSASGPHAVRHDHDTTFALASAENEGWPACFAWQRADATPTPGIAPDERIPSDPSE